MKKLNQSLQIENFVTKRFLKKKDENFEEDSKLIDFL